MNQQEQLWILTKDVRKMDDPGNPGNCGNPGNPSYVNNSGTIYWLMDVIGRGKLHDESSIYTFFHIPCSIINCDSFNQHQAEKLPVTYQVCDQPWESHHEMIGM